MSILRYYFHMNKIFCDRLKDSRKEKELTQKQVAYYLGVVESCYANWEQGRTEPDTKTLAKLSKLYNVSADYLLGLSDEQGGNVTSFIKATPIAARGAESKVVHITKEQEDIAFEELTKVAQKNKNNK